jgi:hypothetical protein
VTTAWTTSSERCWGRPRTQQHARTRSP